MEEAKKASRPSARRQDSNFNEEANKRASRLTARRQTRISKLGTRNLEEEKEMNDGSRAFPRGNTKALQATRGDKGERGCQHQGSRRTDMSSWNSLTISEEPAGIELSSAPKALSARLNKPGEMAFQKLSLTTEVLGIKRIRPQSAPTVPKSVKASEVPGKRVLTSTPAVCTNRKNRQLAHKAEKELMELRKRCSTELEVGGTTENTEKEFWMLSGEIAATLTHRTGTLDDVPVLDPHDEHKDGELKSFGIAFYRLPMPQRVVDVRVTLETSSGSGAKAQVQFLAAIGSAFKPTPGNADIVGVELRSGVHQLKYIPTKDSKVPKELILGILNGQHLCTYQMRWRIDSGEAQKKDFQPGKALAKSRVDNFISELREHDTQRELFLERCDDSFSGRNSASAATSAYSRASERARRPASAGSSHIRNRPPDPDPPPGADIKQRPKSAGPGRGGGQNYVQMNKRSAKDWTAEKQLEKVDTQAAKQRAQVAHARAMHFLQLEQRQVALENREHSNCGQMVWNLELQRLKFEWVRILMAGHFWHRIFTAVDDARRQATQREEENEAASAIQQKYLRNQTYKRQRRLHVFVMKFRVGVTVLVRVNRLASWVQSAGIIKTIMLGQPQSQATMKIKHFFQKVRHVQSMWKRLRIKREARVDILLDLWDKVEAEALEPIFIWEEWVLQKACPSEYASRSSHIPIDIKRHVLMKYVRQMQSLHLQARRSNDDPSTINQRLHLRHSVVGRPAWEDLKQATRGFAKEDEEVVPQLGNLKNKYLGFDVRHEELREIIYHAHNQWRIGVFDDAMRRRKPLPYRHPASLRNLKEEPLVEEKSIEED